MTIMICERCGGGMKLSSFSSACPLILYYCPSCDGPSLPGVIDMPLARPEVRETVAPFSVGESRPKRPNGTPCRIYHWRPRRPAVAPPTVGALLSKTEEELFGTVRGAGLASIVKERLVQSLRSVEANARDLWQRSAFSLTPGTADHAEITARLRWLPPLIAEIAALEEPALRPARTLKGTSSMSWLLRALARVLSLHPLMPQRSNEKTMLDPGFFQVARFILRYMECNSGRYSPVDRKRLAPESAALPDFRITPAMDVNAIGDELRERLLKWGAVASLASPAPPAPVQREWRLRAGRPLLLCRLKRACKALPPCPNPFHASWLIAERLRRDATDLPKSESLLMNALADILEEDICCSLCLGPVF